MRFFITLNFVLLAACLARSQGQDALNAGAEIQARSEAPPTAPAASTDGPAKSPSGIHSPTQLPTVKDPKLCAIIVKRMKDFDAMSKSGGIPSPKTGAAAPPSGVSSSPKPSASGVARRSKLTQRTDIGLNRRESSGTKEASAADPNACKEMETMLKAAREKMQAAMKKGPPGLKHDGAKKDSAPKESSADAAPKTSPADAKPAKSSATTEAKPKTESADATSQTGSAGAEE